MTIPELPWENPILPKLEFRIYACSYLRHPTPKATPTNHRATLPTSRPTKLLIYQPALLSIFRNIAVAPNMNATSL